MGKNNSKQKVISADLKNYKEYLAKERENLWRNGSFQTRRSLSESDELLEQNCIKFPCYCMKRNQDPERKSKETQHVWMNNFVEFVKSIKQCVGWTNQVLYDLNYFKNWNLRDERFLKEIEQISSDLNLSISFVSIRRGPYNRKSTISSSFRQFHRNSITQSIFPMKPNNLVSSDVKELLAKGNIIDDEIVTALQEKPSHSANITPREAALPLKKIFSDENMRKKQSLKEFLDENTRTDTIAEGPPKQKKLSLDYIYLEGNVPERQSLTFNKTSRESTSNAHLKNANSNRVEHYQRNFSEFKGIITEHSNTTMMMEGLGKSANPEFFLKNFPDNLLSVLERSPTAQADDNVTLLKHYILVTGKIVEQLRDHHHPIYLIIKSFEKYFEFTFANDLNKFFDQSCRDTQGFLKGLAICIKDFYMLDEYANYLRVNLFTSENVLSLAAEAFFNTTNLHQVLENYLNKKFANESKILEERYKQLLNARPENFDVPDSLCLNDLTLKFFENSNPEQETKATKLHDSNFKPYSQTIKYLREIRKTKNPYYKLKILVGCSEKIYSEISAFYQSHNREFEKKLGGDEILSIFVYVISQSHIKTLNSHCAFIEKFVNKNTSNSVHGYYLTTCQAATDYLIYNHRKISS